VQTDGAPDNRALQADGRSVASLPRAPAAERQIVGRTDTVINSTWHKNQPMPPRPTAEQRLRWHLGHAEACGCRKLSGTMLKELRRRAREASE
jgi:hypothetical protein